MNRVARAKTVKTSRNKFAKFDLIYFKNIELRFICVFKFGIFMCVLGCVCANCLKNWRRKVENKQHEQNKINKCNYC